jgi:hypothetical protein
MRSTLVAATLFALVGPGARAHAQTATVTELSVATQPALPVAAAAKGEPVWAVPGGGTVQLVVAAHHADGSQTEVTAAGATYRSLAPQVVSAGEGGALQFAAPSGRRAAAVLVEYGGAKRVVSFQVEP